MKHTIRVLLIVLLLLALSATAWAFTDTQGLSSAEQQALEALSGMGVTGGYPDGSFRPANTITRAEFAKMLCVYANKTELADAAASFNDVASGAWYYGWVSRVVEQGWITGYPGGEYRPQNTITQQEIATVLVRLSGVDTAGFTWPDDYNATAQTAGMLKDIAFDGSANASRIVACQMLYNALPPEEADKPLEISVVRGVVTELKDGSVTIRNGKNVSTAYQVIGNLLPDKLILGSYLELTVSGSSVVQVLESVIAKKGTAYWDVALDGKSAIINDKKYDLTEADIFSVNYTLNKTYSSDTFVGGGAIDRDILSLGGRLAAEMAVVLDEDGSTLKAAYLVNASVVISGGRLDVVDGGVSSAKGAGVYFMGRESGLPLASGVPTPTNGLFIHYTIKNGEISGWNTLFDPASPDLPDVSKILTGGNEDAPHAWVRASDGRADTTAINMWADNLPLVVSLSNGGRTMQLGADGSNCTNYWLAEGCLIYEVKNGKISQGSRSSIERDMPVIALVNRYAEICYIFCFMD